MSSYSVGFIGGGTIAFQTGSMPPVESPMSALPAIMRWFGSILPLP